MKYLLLLYMWVNVECLRILSVFPSPTRSHYLSARRILRDLVGRGHEVVSISPFEEPWDNFTWIDVVVRTMYDAVPALKEEANQQHSFFSYQRFVWRTMNAYTDYIVRLPALANFLKNDSSHFDLVFAHDFYQPIFYTLAYKYRAPLIVLSTFGHGHNIHYYMGSQIDYSVPHEFSHLEQALNYVDLLRNIFYVIYDVFGRKVFVHGYQEGFVRDVFGIEGVDLEELETQIDVVLVNSHWTTSMVRANLLNIVEIGGVHVEDPKPLDQNLQEILDGASNGAILVSQGSWAELCSEKTEILTNMLSVLSSLEQRVIIKCSTPEYITAYDNIYGFPWLPQNDILAHPNLRLFITHGGVLSNQEAVLNGVPSVCVPMQASQPAVCRASHRAGYAVHIPMEDLRVDVLNRSIHNILSDSSFKQNIIEVSRRFRDKPSTPLETAIFWIEYTAKHKVTRREERMVLPLLPVTKNIYVALILIILIFIVVSFNKNKYSDGVKKMKST